MGIDTELIDDATYFVVELADDIADERVPCSGVRRVVERASKLGEERRGLRRRWTRSGPRRLCCQRRQQSARTPCVQVFSMVLLFA